MHQFLKNWNYLVSGLVILLFILSESSGEGDFKIFISASRDLMLGKNIYQISYNEWYHYYYDIVFALFLVPLSYLPLYIAKLIWLVINVFFVYRIWKILSSWLPLDVLTKKENVLFTVLSFAFVIRLLLYNFHLAQLTICILYLTLEGLHLIFNDKKIAGSTLLALGINIKILPIVIIPYLMYRNEWRSVFYILSFMLLFLFLPALFIGFDYTFFLLLERWHLINPTNEAHILDTSERSFHSLTTLLATLLMKNCGDIYALSYRRHIADISIENLHMVINVVRGALIIFTLYFLQGLPFKKANSKLQSLYEISYLCLIIPLIFPHQQHYAFFFIFPASSYLIFYFLVSQKKQAKENSMSKNIIIITLMSLVFLSVNSHFLLGMYNHIYDHYKTLTYGALLLMLILAFCKPRKLLIELKND